MSDTNLRVKVKSNSGGSVETIGNCFTDINESENEYFKAIDGIVIHAGTNNVSDGDSPETVIKKVESIVTKVKTACPNAKIIISCVLPRKAASNLVNSTNDMLSKMCTRTGCYFLNNNPVLMKNEKPDFSLY